MSRVAQALQRPCRRALCWDAGAATNFWQRCRRPAWPEAQAFAGQARTDIRPQPRLALAPFAVGAALMQPREDPARALAVADQQMYEDKARSRPERRRAQRRRTCRRLEEFTRMLEGLESKHAILQDGLDALRAMLGFDGSSYYERRGDSAVSDLLYRQPMEIQLTLPTEQFGRPLDSGVVGEASPEWQDPSVPPITPVGPRLCRSGPPTASRASS